MNRSRMLRAATAAVLALSLNVGAVMAQTSGGGSGSSGGSGTSSGSSDMNNGGTTTTTTEQRRGFDAGWLGLIGLFGLLGRKRRAADEPYRRQETRGAHA